jgi:hypothetical protein
MPPESVAIPGVKQKASSHGGGLHRLGKNYRPDLASSAVQSHPSTAKQSSSVQKFSFKRNVAFATKGTAKFSKSSLDRAVSTKNWKDTSFTGPNDTSSRAAIPAAWLNVGKEISEKEKKGFQELEALRNKLPEPKKSHSASSEITSN